MTKRPKFLLSDESVTVDHGGKSHTFRAGTPNYTALKQILLEEAWDRVPQCLTVASSIEEWARGEFTVDGNQISYRGKALPESLNSRIIAMASNEEDPGRMFRFWERLKKNPSWRSVEQLFPFLVHEGIPITDKGTFLAYKKVKRDFTDCYTGKVDNHPGCHPKMDRNEISDDPNVACHFGFHAGALSYAQTYGDSDGHIVVVEIDPENVVCVPYDESARKVRICEYEVVGVHTGLMPDTSYDPDVNDEDEDIEDESETKTKTKTKAEIYEEMDAMSEASLAARPTDLLRGYAANHLKIVGASKIPGGKPVLLRYIHERRS